MILVDATTCFDYSPLLYFRDTFYESPVRTRCTRKSMLMLFPVIWGAESMTSPATGKGSTTFSTHHHCRTIYARAAHHAFSEDEIHAAPCDYDCVTAAPMVHSAGAHIMKHEISDALSSFHWSRFPTWCNSMALKKIQHPIFQCTVCVLLSLAYVGGSTKRFTLLIERPGSQASRQLSPSGSALTFHRFFNSAHSPMSCE